MHFLPRSQTSCRTSRNDVQPLLQRVTAHQTSRYWQASLACKFARTTGERACSWRHGDALLVSCVFVPDSFVKLAGHQLLQDQRLHHRERRQRHNLACRAFRLWSRRSPRLDSQQLGITPQQRRYQLVGILHYILSGDSHQCGSHVELNLVLSALSGPVCSVIS